ncbi:MAG TPA: urease accessory UreF family protein, partial [Ancylobacter sp.]
MNLLRALQHGDSTFPSGGFAFSNGIEGATMLGIALDVGHLGDVVAAVMRHRWATAERVALARAHRAGGDLDRLAEIDTEIEATTLVEGLRLGSRRNGSAMLAAHTRLGTPG